jgi:hypothetical protein
MLVAHRPIIMLLEIKDGKLVCAHFARKKRNVNAIQKKNVPLFEKCKKCVFSLESDLLR